MKMRFGHICWRNPQWKTSIFCVVYDILTFTITIFCKMLKWGFSPKNLHCYGNYNSLSKTSKTLDNPDDEKQYF